RTLLTLPLRIALAYLRLIPDVAIRMLRCDILATGYIGQLDTIVLAPIAKLCGKPVLMNPLVTLTDTIIEDRQLAPARSPVGSVVRWIDRSSLRSASLILTDTEENASYIERNFDVPGERLHVIPVGADERFFFPARDGSSDRECLDVLFYGKFIPLHGTDTIIRAAAIVGRADPAVRFELIGRGQEYSAARQLAHDLRVENVVWTEWMPEDALGDRLRQADVALGVFGASDKAGRVIPNKVHQSLACGIATITRRAGPLERHLRPDRDIVTVQPADPDALATAILRLRDPQLRQQIGVNGRNAWSRFASRSVVADGTRRVLERLNQGR
ncbi:MAG: glycosyltransferase, partial [Chloroflexota bacterium]